MRRPVLAVAGTASGLVLLLSYHASTRAAPTAVVVAAAPPPAPPAPAAAVPSDPPAALPPTPAAASARPSASATAVRTRASTPAPARPSAGGAPSSAPAVVASQVLTGGVAETRYGPVQVQITVTGRRITGARAVQQPDANGQDAAIAAYAVPRLDREVLAAQSARIDAVSGATYTSEGYIGSLQSALDAGHLG